MCHPKVRNGQRSDQLPHEVFDPKAPFLIPHIDFVSQLNPILIDKTLMATTRKATNQAQLATWYKYSNDDVARVSAIRATNPSLNARAQHLATTVTTGPYGRFDVPPAINIKHNPTAFLTSILPYGSDGMSSYQMSIYLILILGLPMQPMLIRDGTCPCGAPRSMFGYHELNCKQWAGKSWHKGHDLCGKALAYVTPRLRSWCARETGARPIPKAEYLPFVNEFIKASCVCVVCVCMRRADWDWGLWTLTIS